MDMDYYMVYRQNEALANESQLAMDRQPPNNADQNFSRKRKRGPTQMRSIWGRRESEGPILVSCNRFGQAEDKNGQTLSSFIGSMIRDGKFAPLTYESWHKVPEKVKDDLWEKAKEKYNLQEASKKWALQKFGRQLNSIICHVQIVSGGRFSPQSPEWMMQLLLDVF